ncbi:MAG: hypothetical protein ACYCSZ_06735 [Burkholderiales bacterium]
MTRIYEAPPAWKPPPKEVASATYLGEQNTSVIYEAVGRALSGWEHAESALIKLYQLLCETKSLAACRAYGTAESVFARYLAQKYAAEEFFASRDETDLHLVVSLLKIYNDAAPYRNQIAHGMAVQPHTFGYFLCPPSYASRRRDTPYPTQLWGLGASYFYRVLEIDHCRDYFENILKAAMSMVLYLNDKYRVLENDNLHP